MQKSTVRRIVRGAGTAKLRMEKQTITSGDRQKSWVRHEAWRPFVSCGRQIDCNQFAIRAKHALPSGDDPPESHRPLECSGAEQHVAKDPCDGPHGSTLRLAPLSGRSSNVFP